MKRPISRKAHGVAEYTFIPALAAAPELAGFANDPVPTNLARGMAAGLLMSASSTKAEWSLFKLVPFRAHLMVDVMAGVFTAAAPWLFGFEGNRRARNAFLAFGVTSIVVGGLLTRPEEMDDVPDIHEPNEPGDPDHSDFVWEAREAGY